MYPSPSFEQIAYSIDDAIKATTLGRTMIFRAIRDGKLETRKFGRRRLILAESLRAFIENREG